MTQHPSIGFALVTQLLGPHGNNQFDKITKTKTVENILSATDVEGVEKYIDYVIGLLRDEGTESKCVSYPISTPIKYVLNLTVKLGREALRFPPTVGD